MLALSESRIRQSRLWLPALSLPTVFAVEDKAAAYKRAFASTLVVLRGESGLGSQETVAAMIPTSGPTYRRWEKVDAPALPDAWQINRLCELFECKPDDLIHPKPLTEREVRMARRLGRLSVRVQPNERMGAL